MGLFSNIFGSKDKTSDATIAAGKLAEEEAAEAARKKAENDALLADQAKKRKEFAARSTRSQGGGREGLMYRKNQQGVA